MAASRLWKLPKEEVQMKTPREQKIRDEIESFGVYGYGTDQIKYLLQLLDEERAEYTEYRANYDRIFSTSVIVPTDEYAAKVSKISYLESEVTRLNGVVGKAFDALELLLQSTRLCYSEDKEAEANIQKAMDIRDELTAGRKVWVILQTTLTRPCLKTVIFVEMII